MVAVYPRKRTATLLTLTLTNTFSSHNAIAIKSINITENIKEFISQVQIYIREDYPVFLLMTGLFENVFDLQNEKTMTFLYRAPKIELQPLSISLIAANYGKIFSLGESEALDMAKATNGYPFAYQALGIGRLIYQLPMPLCRLFIKEIFGDSSPRNFDEEITETINKFFDNSLNVSETSRQLYIHRNTLVYRLDKVQKNTGLDLRVFDDAITLKIAMMVSNYMDYVDGLEYK